MNAKENSLAPAINESKHLSSNLTKIHQAAAYELPIIQQGDNLLISAQLLHKKLEVTTRFNDWFQRRVEKYGFENQKDFYSNLSKSTGGRKSIDYLLSIDTAKELSMLEENETGRRIRRYFIQKEKEARGVSLLPNEAQLFRGLKPANINDREMYPYRAMLQRCGYSRNSNGDRRHRYWMHFVKYDDMLYITREFALHLWHQKQVLNNRSVMLASRPVLPFNFGEGGIE